MKRAAITLALFAPACLNAEVERKDSGVAVGNPGEMTARVASGGDLTLEEAWLSIDALTLDGCDDTSVRVAQDLVFDLTGDPRVLLPAGEWCALWIEDARLQLAAGDGSTSLTLDLPLEVGLEANGGFTLSEGATLLQLGPEGWLSIDALDLDPGANVIDADDDRADDVLDAIEAESLLVDDPDGDGERSNGDAVLASGDEADEQGNHDDDDDDNDDDDDDESTAGCGGGDAAVLLPLVLLGWGRRRSAPWANA